MKTIGIITYHHYYNYGTMAAGSCLAGKGRTTRLSGRVNRF